MLDLLSPLDPNSSVPFYRQIERTLAEQIEAGVLAPGEQLATVRQVADRLGVNFNTVARAYRALEAAGLVVTHRGRGTFVPAAEGPSPPLAELTEGFLGRLYRQGFSAQEARWEFAAAIRRWMQAGVPPGVEGE